MENWPEAISAIQMESGVVHLVKTRHVWNSLNGRITAFVYAYKFLSDFATFYYCFCLSLFEILFLWDNYGPAMDVMSVCHTKELSRQGNTTSHLLGWLLLIKVKLRLWWDVEYLNGLNTSASNVKWYRHCGKTLIYFFLSKITYITATTLQPTILLLGPLPKKFRSHRGSYTLMFIASL